MGHVREAIDGEMPEDRRSENACKHHSFEGTSASVPTKEPEFESCVKHDK